MNAVPFILLIIALSLVLYAILRGPHYNFKVYYCENCDKYNGENEICPKCGKKGKALDKCCDRDFADIENFCPSCSKRARFLEEREKNPIRLLIEKAKEEHKNGKTISLEEVAKKNGIELKN